MSEHNKSAPMSGSAGQSSGRPPGPDADSALSGSSDDAQKTREMATQARSGIAGRMTGAGMPTEKASNFSESGKRLVGRLGPERILVVMVMVLAIVSVTLSVLGPRQLGNATTEVVKGLFSPKGIDFTALRNTLLAIVTLYAFSALAAWIQGRILAGVVQRTMSRLRSEVEHKINRLPLPYVDRAARGDLLSRVTNDIDNIAQSLQQTLSQMLTSTLTLVGTMIMMFVVSWPLALVALIMIPMSLYTTKFIAGRSKPRFIAQWRHTGALNAQVEEAFTGHALVKVFGQQKAFEKMFADTNQELYHASFSAQFISGIIQPAMAFIGNLNYVAIAVIGGMRVASGSMAIGDIQSFIQYSRQFTQPLTQLASMANVFQSGVASAERVFELLDQPEESIEPVPVTAEPPKGLVEFDHVTFSYDPERPLITDLSLTAQPGQTVAIVGPTGAGKTTLVNLIMRFYELNSGEIRIDGRNVADISRQELRSLIGMVLQDTWLFDGTIHDNIAYGNLNATEEQIQAAAAATFVDRFAHSLPDGLNTVVDDEGGAISAGEKQLITIARAFLAAPTILILDEATSSVDTRTEVLIQHAMAALRAHRTSFVIAHRLSTIRDADVILVMENGSIVEQGDHETLLATDGAYARLYNSQFAGAAAEIA